MKADELPGAGSRQGEAVVSHEQADARAVDPHACLAAGAVCRPHEHGGAGRRRGDRGAGFLKGKCARQIDEAGRGNAAGEIGLCGAGEVVVVEERAEGIGGGRVRRGERDAARRTRHLQRQAVGGLHDLEVAVAAGE